MQLCRECRWLYASETRMPCLSCESTRLTIPCAENLVGIVERLLDRGLEVVSASCDVFDTFDKDTDKIGKIILSQIELGFLYPGTMFRGLPPDWMTYEFHTVENNTIGPKFTGLSHSERFVGVDDDELDFATMLTISNLEVWLDALDADGYRSAWILAGYI